MLIDSYFDNQVKLIQLTTYHDFRGCFMQTYDEEIEKACGFKIKQENLSISGENVLRGMHYQWDEPMSKLVQCVYGEIVDFVLDIRKDSKTFGRSEMFVLNEPSELLLVPAGFAHGFYSTSDHSIVKYHCSCYYNKDAEGSINFFDHELDLKNLWTIDQKHVTISDRDAEAISFETYRKHCKF